MRLESENIEEIYSFNRCVNWIETPCRSHLAIVFDHPALTPDRYDGLFSPRERAEGRAKSAPAAFRGWFLGRLAAKAAAARLLGRPPDQVEIFKGRQGRPEIEGGAGRVSISHTLGAAAAAAGRGPVGLDLERADRRLGERMRRWAFTEKELELAGAGGGENGSPWPAHLALWCAREAGAKAWGRGLLNHLDQVRVAQADWPAGRLRVDWLGPQPARIWIDLIRAGDYLLALAGGGESARSETPQLKRKNAPIAARHVIGK